MKKYLWLLLICFFSEMSLFAQSRIIGGYPVNISERPFQAGILVGDKIGGGIIIAPQWILTAAHLVINGNNAVSPSSVQVYTGNTSMLSGTLSFASQIIVHPSYSRNSDGTANYDVALIKLNSPLSLGSNCQPVTITDVSYYYNTSAVISGWGRRSTASGSSSPEQLYAANVTIQSSDGSLLTVSPSGNMEYSGDSGGPLTINDPVIGPLLVGIASSASSASNPTLYPTHYANVGYVQKWIASSIGISNTYSLSVPSIVLNQETCSILNKPTNVTVSWGIENTNISRITDQGVITAIPYVDGPQFVTAVMNASNGAKFALHGRTVIGIPDFYITRYDYGEGYPPSSNTFCVNTNYIFMANPVPGYWDLSGIPFTFFWKLKDSNGNVIDYDVINNVGLRIGIYGVKFPAAGDYTLEVEIDRDYKYKAFSRSVVAVGCYPYRATSNSSNNQLIIQKEKSNNGIDQMNKENNHLATAQLYSSASLVRSISFNSDTELNMDISSLPTGFYFLVITENGKIVQRQKIIVKR